MTSSSVPQHAAGDDSFDHRGVRAATGELEASGMRFGVVVARFNASITADLYRGAVDALLEAGARAEDISAVTVPGAVEIALAAQRFAGGDCDAVIVLGCVIRGETAHFDYVCKAVSEGCTRVSLDHGVPVGFGVLTCETVDQARARSRFPGGANVGRDAAHAAIETVASGKRSG